ncbi:hypothetical protein TZ00_13225 [Agreia bicolorata]|uniref:Tetracyclin repressor SCO1712-like C-terminal domain-containing protein n=1 Tax=Agreia bicolorata TaxID=110935 RepID=A0ABR5CD27_9MICO|nr:hypothetical protein TZ00_13225 [Agreia bicolorata]
MIPKYRKSHVFVDSILDAARAIAMGQEGPMTTTRIAEVAGCSVAGLYRYFCDVHDIRCALVAQDWSLYEQAVEAYRKDHVICAPADVLSMHFHIRESTLREGSGPIPAVQRYQVADRPTESDRIARLHLQLVQPSQPAINEPSLHRHLELVVRLADALIRRAFTISPDGDPAMLRESKLILDRYVTSYLSFTAQPAGAWGCIDVAEIDGHRER